MIKMTINTDRQALHGFIFNLLLLVLDIGEICLGKYIENVG